MSNAEYEYQCLCKDGFEGEVHAKVEKTQHVQICPCQPPVYVLLHQLSVLTGLYLLQVSAVKSSKTFVRATRSARTEAAA